jgi:hypothetical protein
VHVENVLQIRLARSLFFRTMTQLTQRVETAAADTPPPGSSSDGEQNATPVPSDPRDDGSQSYEHNSAQDVEEEHDEEEGEGEDDLLADYFENLSLKWMPDPDKHGTNMIVVTLDSSYSFTMHRKLLQHASPRLRRLINQSKISEIHLPDISAEEFATIYRYLYGKDIWKVSDSTEDESDSRSDELLWLCTLKAASALEMHDLADGIYTLLTQRMLKLPCNEFGFPTDFMTELYASDQPQFKLRAFLATLAAYNLLQRDVCNRMAFLDFMQKNRNFGRDILVEIALFSDLSCCCDMMHPSDISRFLIPELQAGDVKHCLIHKATTARDFKKELQFSARLKSKSCTNVAKAERGQLDGELL